MNTCLMPRRAVALPAVKYHFIFLLVAFFCFSLGASAQIINKDSLSLTEKIRSDQEKLSRLQGNLAEAEKEKMQSAEKAQQSADDNRKAANKLSDDPQDRKLARRAHNEASDARSDAKKARKASDRLVDLNKDIQQLADRIAKNQTKLNRFQAVGSVRAVPQVSPQD